MNVSTPIKACGFGLAVLVWASPASADVFSWTGGGDGMNWEDPQNWNLGALPGADDLVFSGGGGRTIYLSSDQEIDAVRFNDGDNLIHTAGTLTVGGAGPDTESSFPEFGPAGSAYTMRGTARYNQTDGGLFILGRAAAGTLNMSEDASMSNAGEIWFGMDSAFEGNVSGNASITSQGSMQMARFASPSAVLRLSDNAVLNTEGFFVMSDAPDLSGSSTLELTGSGLSVGMNGLFMREGATLSFIADAGGVSALSVGGPADLFDNAGGLDPRLLVDLSAWTGSGPVTLIDMADGPVNGMFRGLAEGSVVAGTGGLTITYAGGMDGFDVVLIPAPASAVLAAGGLLAAGRRRRARA
jgi:hypothetical protein